MSKNEPKKEKTSLSDYERLKSLIEDPAMVKSFSVALNGIPVMPWIKGALTCIWRDKKLRRATEQSVVGVLMQAATMGLRFEDALGQAYLSTREVWKYDTGSQKTVFSHVDAQLQIGYRGFIDIAHRDPNVRQVEAVIIRERDNVDFYKGSKPFIDHNWDIKMGARDRGRIVAIYSGLRYKDEFYAFEIYPFDEILEHRNTTLEERGIIVKQNDEGDELFFKKANKWARYSEVDFFDDGGVKRYFLQQTNGDGRIFPLTNDEKSNIPWIAYLIAMGKKTTIRWSAKYWPMSPEFHSAAYFAETEEHGLEQKIEDTVLELIPEEIRKRFIEKKSTNSSGVKIDRDRLSPSQQVSASQMSNLAAHMAREAGIVNDDDDTSREPSKGADEDAGKADDDMKTDHLDERLAQLEKIKDRDEEKKKKMKTE